MSHEEFISLFVKADIKVQMQVIGLLTGSKYPFSPESPQYPIINRQTSTYSQFLINNQPSSELQEKPYRKAHKV